MTKYQIWYNNITSRSLSKPNDSKYYEKHHIIPKSLGGSNEKSNICWLTPREHFICHMLLVKMYDGKSKIKMSWALHLMMHQVNKHQIRYIPCSRRFAVLKEQFYSNLKKPRLLTETHKKNIANANTKRLKGTKLSESWKRNLSESRKGKIWIHKDSDSKIVNPSELDNFIKLGWSFGRPIKRNSTDCA